jgi:hypothetical protein
MLPRQKPVSVHAGARLMIDVDQLPAILRVRIQSVLRFGAPSCLPAHSQHWPSRLQSASLEPSTVSVDMTVNRQPTEADKTHIADVAPDQQRHVWSCGVSSCEHLCGPSVIWFQQRNPENSIQVLIKQLLSMQLCIHPSHPCPELAE